jgi:hypothetical protein
VLSAQETQWMFDLNGITSLSSVTNSDNEGNIFFTNSFVNSGSFQFKDSTITTTNTVNSNTYNLLLSKITPDSNLVWTFSTDVATGQIIGPIDLTIDEVGSIYLLVSYNASSLGNINLTSNITLTYPRFGRRNAILKFNKNGVPLWAREYGRLTTDPSGQLFHKLVYLNGRIYISHIIRGQFEYEGSSQNITTIHDRSISIASYDTSGQFVWVKQIGSAPNTGNVRRGFRANNHSIFVAAYLNKEIFFNQDTVLIGHNIIKLDTSGSIIDYIHIKYATPDISGFSGIQFDIDKIIT